MKNLLLLIAIFLLLPCLIWAQTQQDIRRIDEEKYNELALPQLSQEFHALTGTSLEEINEEEKYGVFLKIKGVNNGKTVFNKFIDPFSDPSKIDTYLSYIFG